MITQISTRTIQHASKAHATSFVELLAAVVAFWPVWSWYCDRIFDRSDEPLGVIALLTVVVLSARERIQHRNIDVIELNAAVREQADQAKIERLPSLVAPLTLVLLYCCLSQHLPLVLQSVIAIAVVGMCLLRTGVSRFPLAGGWALLLLSLPMVASFNFYLGYPLRLLASYLASIMLNLSGLSVKVQGAAILWNDTDVSIDQPCSGIRMLWVAFYLAATLASIFRLKVRSTIHLLVLSVVSAVAANAVRVSSLFYLESGILRLENPWHGLVHSGIGIVAFFLVTLIIARSAFAMSKPEETVGQPRRTAEVIGCRSVNELTAFAISCALAAVLPLIVRTSQPTAAIQQFRSWPTRFEGRALVEQKLSPDIERFANRFPGHIAVFASGKCRVVFRWITQPTRQLHPSEDCYRASGYKIRWLPEHEDSERKRWTVFEATRDCEKLLVRERLFDESGNSWTDVSAWYWSAVLQKSKAPWWSVCVIEPIGTDSH